MNTGPIAARYASALLKYVTYTGHAGEVYAQVKALLADPSADAGPLHEDLQKFMTLLMGNGRVEYVKRILLHFVTLYDRAHDIHPVQLVTAVDSPELQERLRIFAKEKLGGNVELKCSVDESLIGGFILEFDDYRMDASVSRQLETIKRICNN